VQIGCTMGYYSCLMIEDTEFSGLQSPGIKKYLQNLVNFGLENNFDGDGFFALKKEVKDRIILLEQCNQGMRLDWNSALEILQKIKALKKAIDDPGDFRQLENNVKQYAEKVLLYAVQKHFKENNYNQWFETRKRNF
jgi:hypothetical protein